MQGYTTNLAVVDLFIKMAHFIPCKGPLTAQEAVLLVWTRSLDIEDCSIMWFQRKSVHLLTEPLWHLLSIKVHLSSLHHPESNGESEKLSHMLQQYLRCFISYQQDNWTDLLPITEAAYKMQHILQSMHPSSGQLTDSTHGSDPTARNHHSSCFLHERPTAQTLLKEQIELAKTMYKKISRCRQTRDR
uniref:Integrase catalytic domain-containing protein n=1 Tax=Micrurus lemniscatus lemniscatus TaxID=129467 RepID=A0A2D4HCC9_MICLE